MENVQSRIGAISGEPTASLVRLDPVLTNRLMQVLHAKLGNVNGSVTASSNASAQQTMTGFVLTSSNNVFTIKQQPQPQVISVLPPTAAVLSSPQVSPLIPNIMNNLQDLQHTNPRLYGGLMNQVTGQIIAQLSTGIADLISNAVNAVAADRTVDLSNSVDVINQRLTTLINISSLLATSICSLNEIQPTSTINPTLVQESSAPSAIVVSNPTTKSEPSVKDVKQTEAQQNTPTLSTGVWIPQESAKVKHEVEADRSSGPPVAGMRTKSGRILKSILANSPPKCYKCSFWSCKSEFTLKYHLIEHARFHRRPKPFICPKPCCHGCFKSILQLQKHLKKQHNGPVENPSKPSKGNLLITSILPCRQKVTTSRHVCPFSKCEYSSSRRHRLNEHLAVHTGFGPFYCKDPTCKQRCFNKDDYERHKVDHLQEKKYKCIYEGCGKAYSRLNKLREHVRTHTGERPFQCTHPGCEASFARAYALTRHSFRHEVPATTAATGVFVVETQTPAAVSLPSLVTTTPPEPKNVSSLTQALKQLQPATIVPPVGASLVVTTGPSKSRTTLIQRSSKAAATPSASALAEKAIVVAGPFGRRRHICPYPGCTKIFPKMNKLREHICRHTNERPYACSECPATFVRMYDLSRHSNIHQRKKNGILGGPI